MCTTMGENSSPFLPSFIPPALTNSLPRCLHLCPSLFRRMYTPVYLSSSRTLSTRSPIPPYAPSFRLPFLQAQFLQSPHIRSHKRTHTHISALLDLFFLLPKSLFRTFFSTFRILLPCHLMPRYSSNRLIQPVSYAYHRTTHYQYLRFSTAAAERYADFGPVGATGRQ